MHAQLIPVDGGPPIDLNKDLTVVGRLDQCDLKIDDISVSKMHCVLLRDHQSLMVRDLGSTNGTRVNGLRVRRASLNPNDQLTIANSTFRILLGPDRPAIPVNPDSQTVFLSQPKPVEIPQIKEAVSPEAHDYEQLSLSVNDLPDQYEERVKDK